MSGTLTFAQGISYINPSEPVVVSTGGSGSPYTIFASQTGSTFTNQGATAKAYFNLPAAGGDLSYSYIVQDADGIRVVAASGDTIRVAASVSSSGGYAESTTIGDTITLKCINSTEWISVATNGTWSLA